MLTGLYITAFVVGVAAALLTLAGVVALVKKRHSRAFWLALSVVLGCPALLATTTYLSVRVAVANVAPDGDDAARAKALAQAISEQLNCGAIGLFATPVASLVMAAAGVGRLLARRANTEMRR